MPQTLKSKVLDHPVKRPRATALIVLLVVAVLAFILLCGVRYIGDSAFNGFNTVNPAPTQQAPAGTPTPTPTPILIHP